MMGQHQDPQVYQQLRHQYGLDKPILQQYVEYMGGVLKLDFGLSYQEIGRPVSEMIVQGIPASAELGFWGFLLTICVGLPLGILAALKANTWIDTLVVGLSLLTWALPSFILAVFAQVFIVWLNKAGFPWPVANWGQPWQYGWEDLQYKIVPIVVYAALSFAGFVRYARSTMLEVLRQDYVRTARAKGMSERVVIYRHAFRNALIPLVTLIGVSVGFLITGSFFIEQIFNIPGIGSIGLNAINNRDYPVIVAATLLFASCAVVGNLISDLLYSVVDPRIKVE